MISLRKTSPRLYPPNKKYEHMVAGELGAVNAVRFIYGITLGRNTEALTTSVPHMKHAIRRPEVYARSELEAILSAPSQPRDRAFLMTVYA